MPEIADTQAASRVEFCSSLAADAWHEQAGVGAYETWRFDAVSEDGREAVVITFYDNFPFSSRYLNYARNGNGHSITPKRFPAVSFVYSIDGKAVFRAINEFGRADFRASADSVGCTIGKSSFHVDTATYGSGFMVNIDLLTARKRRIIAEMEWLSVESDMSRSGPAEKRPPVFNMVAPRSDVSGRISLVGRRGRLRSLVQFRGTGSHEHFQSSGPTEGVRSEYVGCAHFTDATAIFYHRDHVGSGNRLSKLFMIREGEFHERNAAADIQNITRNLFGLKVPRRLSFSTHDLMRLRVKPVSLIRSGFCEVDMISEMTLTLRDGKPRKTFGITEFIEPQNAKRRLVRWLSNLRVGRNDRPPLI